MDFFNASLPAAFVQRGRYVRVGVPGSAEIQDTFDEAQKDWNAKWGGHAQCELKLNAGVRVSVVLRDAPFRSAVVDVPTRRRKAVSGHALGLSPEWIARPYDWFDNAWVRRCKLTSV